MKYLLSLLAAIFIFSNVGPYYASATSESNKPEATNEEPTTIDNEELQTETVDMFGEDLEDNNVEVQSKVVDETEVIETTIETDDLSAEGELELDLESNEMVVSAELENESGELVQQSFEVYLSEVNGDDFVATLRDIETDEQYEINTTEVQASWYPLVLIAIQVARFGINYAIKKHGKSIVNKAVSKYGKKAATKDLKKLKFANTKKFDEHHEKHKKEFGNISKTKYLEKAQALAGVDAKHVLTKKRSNGDILKYNTKTNELLSLTKDDVIKTFFKPKHPNAKKGREYFDKQ
ncbi:SAR2788 family putative toxin [Peribacillus castrilensis]|uniref:SAR2788 family putative toxin n=1 Tax=Peribacillus TaxID=2675229 RepID=UPI0038711DD2